MTLGITLLFLLFVAIVIVVVEFNYNSQSYICDKCKIIVRKTHRYVPLGKTYKCFKGGNKLTRRVM